MEDAGKGEAKVSIQVSSDTSENAEPVYFSLALPEEYYANGSMRAGGGNAIPLSAVTENGHTQQVSGSVKFISPERQLELSVSEPADLIVRRENSKGQLHTQVYLPIPVGNLSNRQSITRIFTIIASGKIDKKPVSLVLDTANAGRAFAG